MIEKKQTSLPETAVSRKKKLFNQQFHSGQKQPLPLNFILGEREVDKQTWYQRQKISVIWKTKNVFEVEIWN